MNNNIIIIDWAGNILFKGNYKDKNVNLVLSANRCSCDHGCEHCDGTGYVGDFEVYWQDDLREDNVFEFINY